MRAGKKIMTQFAKRAEDFITFVNSCITKLDPRNWLNSSFCLSCSRNYQTKTSFFWIHWSFWKRPSFLCFRKTWRPILVVIFKVGFLTSRFTRNQSSLVAFTVGKRWVCLCCYFHWLWERKVEMPSLLWVLTQTVLYWRWNLFPTSSLKGIAKLESSAMAEAYGNSFFEVWFTS